MVLENDPTRKIRLGVTTELVGGIGYLQPGTSKSVIIYIVENAVGSADELSIDKEKISEEVGSTPYVVTDDQINEEDLEEIEEMIEAMKLSCQLTDD
jgi:hypothetical protein